MRVNYGLGDDDRIPQLLRGLGNSSLREGPSRLTTTRNSSTVIVHFHDLQHTFASWLIMRGRPLKEIQKLLGTAPFG